MSEVHLARIFRLPVYCGGALGEGNGWLDLKFQVEMILPPGKLIK
jgi:hypothetical protein